MGRCNSPNIKYSTTHKSQQTNKTSKDTMCDYACYVHVFPSRFELYATADFISDIWQGKGHPRLVSGDHRHQYLTENTMHIFFLSRSSTYPDEPENSKRLEMPLSCQRNGLCFSRSQRVCNIHCCRLKKQQEWQERTRRGFLKLTAAYGKFCGLPLIAKTFCLIEMTWRTFPGRRPRERINLSHTVSQPGAVSFNFSHNAYPPTQRCVPYAGNWGTCVNCKQNYICPFSSFHQEYIYI